MKSKILIPVILFSISIVSLSFAQKDSFVDKAPIKSKASITPEASVGIPSNEIQDKDPNAKAIPIPSDDMFDLIFEYPCAIGGGEAGIETDGIFIYTTKWNGDQFYKYEMDGTFIDSLTISGVSNIRDLAWDGTCFFGGAASPTVYELDLGNATLISTFTAPTDVRAIAYYEDDDTFYANNWGSYITKFNKSGSNLGSFPVGPVGDSYYGFEIDDFCYPTYLYGYAQVGATQNEIIEMNFYDGYETGVYFDVGSVVNVGLGIAGGLCSHYIGSDQVLIGMSQNVVIWGLELCPGCAPCNDVGVNSIIEPSSGVGGFTNDEIVTVEIKNFGFNSQSDIIVSFTYNGSPPYFDTAFTTLNMNETYEHTFDTTIDMTVGSTHIIESCTHLFGDEDPLNDCKTKVISVPLFCTLEGYVTNCLSGDPLNGAIVTCGTWAASTGADGYYIFSNILPGTHAISCDYDVFCPFDTTITFTQGSVITLDIELCPPQLEIDPDTLYITMDPNTTTSSSVTLSNPGNCDVVWNVNVSFNQKELFDLQYEYPCEIATGEAGIETDGSFLYTTMWNGSDFHQYGLDGTYIGSFTVSGVSGVRDLAFDGNYFYGAAASPTVFEMDFNDQILISTFTAPIDVRAIAYDFIEDAFYANNWGSDITKFDKTGTLLGSFPVGPVGDNYYGFAYEDNSSYISLWGYAQVGNTQNELVHIELPEGVETGVYLDVASVLNGTVTSLAGGLFTHPNLMSGTWTIGGLVQNEWLWGLELATAQPPWLQINPASGTLETGTSEDISVYFNSTDLLPGVYEADLIFTISPEIDQVIVHVVLTVEGLMPPINLSGYYDCTDIGLSWEVPPPAQPDSFYVYRNDTLIAVVPPNFIDTMVMPEIEYGYYVVALYNGNPSPPSLTIYITVPTPSDLEPIDPEAIMHYPGDFDVTLLWEEPDACLSPDGYNIFRNDEQINLTLVTETTYIDPSLTYGFYEYYVTAVYYFGESDPSNLTYALFYGIDELSLELCKIFPNPSGKKIYIEADYPIDLIQIFDIHGKLILSNTINQKKTQIDVSLFEPGVYFISFDIEEKTVLRKIVVE